MKNLKRAESEIRYKINNIRIVFGNKYLRSATVGRTKHFTESKKGEHCSEGFTMYDVILNLH